MSIMGQACRGTLDDTAWFLAQEEVLIIYQFIYSLSSHQFETNAYKDSLNINLVGFGKFS